MPELWTGCAPSTSSVTPSAVCVTDLQGVHIRRTHEKSGRLIVRPVFSPAPVTPGSDVDDPLRHLGTQERAVLSALVESAGKVVSRRELARRIGLADQSARRCDSLLVGVRRVLPDGAIRTVRSRGWMLDTAVVAETITALDRAD